MTITTLELPVHHGSITLPPQYRTTIRTVSVNFAATEKSRTGLKMSYKKFLGKYPPVLEDNDIGVLSETLTQKYA